WPLRLEIAAPARELAADAERRFLDEVEADSRDRHASHYGDEREADAAETVVPAAIDQLRDHGGVPEVQRVRHEADPLEAAIGQKAAYASCLPVAEDRGKEQ